MTLNDIEMNLLVSVTKDLFEKLAEEPDALEVRQSAFEKHLGDGKVVQVQINIVTDVEDFIEHFTTVVVGKYEHPSV
jgi:hypothetical protein